MNYSVLVRFPFEKPGTLGWCRDTFGKGRWYTSSEENKGFDHDDKWRAIRKSNGMKIEFVNEADAMLFALRFL
jgi:hypothetical protein